MTENSNPEKIVREIKRKPVTHHMPGIDQASA